MSENPRARGATTILAEIASVVFAVLLALAVDQWWEDRERAQFADRALASIAEEMRGNRDQLLKDTLALAPAPVLATLDSAVHVIRTGGEPLGGVAVTWSAALLSSAAWETARMTGATEEIALERVIDLAQLYEFQRVFSEVQAGLSSTMLDLAARMEQEPLAALLEFRGRYAHAASLRQTLSTLYACQLVALEGPDADEAGDCPRPLD